MKNNAGFTLVEMTMVTAMTVVVGGIVIMGLLSTLQAVKVSEASTESSNQARSVLAALEKELCMAGTVANTTVTPAVSPIAITYADVDTGRVSTIEFQEPTGTGWSTPIRFTYLNEDDNGNGALDGDEDTDGDGVLSRRIVRTQTTGGKTVTTIVAAANDVSDWRAELTLDKTQRPSLLDLTIQCSRRMEDGTSAAQAHQAQSEVSTNIYLSNQ